MNKFLERRKLLKLTQEKIENVNRFTTRKDIELIINLPTKKAQDHLASLVNSTTNLKN